MLKIDKSRTLNNRTRKQVFSKEDLKDPESGLGTSVLDEINQWWFQNVTMSAKYGNKNNPEQRSEKEKYGSIARASGEVQCGYARVLKNRNHTGYMVSNGFLDDPNAFYVIVKMHTDWNIPPRTVFNCMKDMILTTTGLTISTKDLVAYRPDAAPDGKKRGKKTDKDPKADKTVTMSVSNGTKWDDPEIEAYYYSIGIQRFEKMYDWYVVKFEVENNLTDEEEDKLKEVLDNGGDLYEDEENMENDGIKLNKDGEIEIPEDMNLDSGRDDILEEEKIGEGFFDEGGNLVGDVPPEAIEECSKPGDRKASVEKWMAKLDFEKNFPYDKARATLKTTGMDLPEKIDEMDDHDVAMHIFWTMCCDLKEQKREWEEGDKEDEFLPVYSLESPVQEKINEGSGDDITVQFPEWAVNYAVNGDDSGLTSEEVKMIRDYLESMDEEGYDAMAFDVGDEAYFSSSPEFGDACDCYDVTFHKKIGQVNETEPNMEDKTEDALKTPFVAGKVYRDTNGDFYKVIRRYPTSIVCTFRGATDKAWSKMREDIKTLATALFGEAEKVVGQDFSMTSLDECGQEEFGSLYEDCPITLTEAHVTINTVGDLKRELGKYADNIKVQFSKGGTLVGIDDMTMANAVLTFNMGEGYVFEDENNGDSDDFVVKDMHSYGRIDPKVLKTAQKELYKFMSENRDHFKDIPLDKIFSILKRNGITPVQEDGTEWSGFLMGNNSNCTIDLAYDGKLIRHMLVLTWYKYNETGTWEVISYIS